MASQHLMNIYLQQINDYLLPNIEFKNLEQSCNSENRKYAKEILTDMHELFVAIYGTDTLDSSYEFVCVPAVIRGDETGRITLGLVQLDLESSGEHWGTAFCTRHGVINQGDSDAGGAILSKDFIPYSYWYTVQIPSDIHDQGEMPEAVKEIRDACQSGTPEMTMQ